LEVVVVPDSGLAVRVAATIAKTTIHTVPALTKFYIKSINVANPTAVSQAVNLWVGGFLLFPNINIPKYGGVRDSDTHVLVTAGIIEVEASSAALIVTIDGVEET
jgi:hypothetical protein